jgi:hypothetical protein
MHSGSKPKTSRKRFIQALAAGFAGVGGALGLAATPRQARNAGSRQEAGDRSLPEVRRAARNVESRRLS